MVLGWTCTLTPLPLTSLVSSRFVDLNDLAPTNVCAVKTGDAGGGGGGMWGGTRGGLWGAAGGVGGGGGWLRVEGLSICSQSQLTYPLPQASTPLPTPAAFAFSHLQTVHC